MTHQTHLFQWTLYYEQNQFFLLNKRFIYYFIILFSSNNVIIIILIHATVLIVDLNCLKPVIFCRMCYRNSVMIHIHFVHLDCE